MINKVNFNHLIIDESFGLKVNCDPNQQSIDAAANCYTCDTSCDQSGSDDSGCDYTCDNSCDNY